MNDFSNTTKVDAGEEFDNLIGANGAEAQAAAEARRDQRRSDEVNDLFGRTGITREQIETDNDDPGPDWAEKLGAEYKAQESAPKTNHLNGTANKIADELVPEFGKTLTKYEPSALAYGFPPAVDVLITKAKLDEQRTAMVLDNFKAAFAVAATWKAKAEEIVVVDESQTDLILRAKDLHAIVRDERINVEKKRKLIKEPALRECQLVDGIANVYKELLEPTEKHLLAQARFAEIRQAERRDQLRAERSEKLRLFEVDSSMFPNLGDMTDEAFEMVYSGVREQYHSRKETEKEQERQRVERERQAQIENERLRAENERLETERKAETERTAEQRRIAEEAEAKRKAAQDELDRQAAERRAEEARAAAEADRKRRAPDKDKLTEWGTEIQQFTMQAPVIDDPQLTTIRNRCIANIDAALRSMQREITAI